MAESRQLADKADAAAGRKPRPVIDRDICKGCGRCVAACPRHVLRLSSELNRGGVRPAEYLGEGCTGCAICYYNCPEMYALEVHTPAQGKPRAGRAGRAGVAGKASPH
ncbi:MAG: ferredoxin family protein [Kiritimatiellae bacterium]|nr:ferredoxin family protein [Kiritimatiellia bacterium]